MIRSNLLLLFALIQARPLAGQSVQKDPAKPAVDDTTTPVPSGRFSRWLDLQTGNLATRYKGSEVSNSPWIYQFQYQFQAKGRFNFDREGRYYAGMRLGTGDVFTHSWNSTGVGDGDLVTNIYLKELFFSATRWKMFELQFGGIGINRGESTEITSYSNNGYLMGERLSIRRPDKFFFDEISATGAFIGDQESPGVIQRFHRLSKLNYHQFLVAKKVHKQISLSADYTFQDGIETLRQAIRVYPRKNRFVDSVLFENCQRLDFRPAWGCAVSIQKNRPADWH